MSLNASSEVIQFLEIFFGESNQLDWTQIETVEGQQGRLYPWAERLAKGLPTVLPHVQGNETYWYGLANSERQLRGWREELTAFVGFTWSTFRGQRAILDLSDPVEEAIQSLTKGAAFKFQGRKDVQGRSTELWKQLEKMRHVLDRKVEFKPELSRPVGRVLREFYMALQALDRAAAEKELQYLRDRNYLDALNLLFLEVRLLSELNQWDELLKLSRINELLQIRRPLAVTQALVQAVYNCKLLQFEETNALDDAVTYFHEQILPQYGNLYSIRAGSKVPEVVKSFMLLAVGNTLPYPALRDELLAISEITPSDRDYIQRLAKLLPNLTNPTVDAYQEAEQAARDCNFDRVFTLLSGLPTSFKVVSLLLETAFELQTLESERAALQAFESLSPDEQTSIRNRRKHRDFLASLIGKTDATPIIPVVDDLIPTDWLKWLEILSQNPQWERAIYSARQGSSEWNVATLLNYPNAITNFVELQESAFIVAEPTLRESLPHLIASFQNDVMYPRREFLPIYSSLLELLADTTEGGDPDFALFHDLATAILGYGVSDKQYVGICDRAVTMWNQYASLNKVDWAIDLLNTLVEYSCPLADKRNEFAVAVAAKLGERLISRRVSPDQWTIFRLLVEDLGLADIIPDLLGEQAISLQQNNDEANLFQKLQGKSILIYTLMEPVAQRAKRFLESVCDRITVHLSHDKGGNDRLEQWVKQDDLVVIVTASAKHATTGFIEQKRPKGMTLPLLVNSKGISSLLREIVRYLDSIQ
jgi:hypothetical protein